MYCWQYGTGAKSPITELYPNDDDNRTQCMHHKFCERFSCVANKWTTNEKKDKLFAYSFFRTIFMAEVSLAFRRGKWANGEAGGWRARETENKARLNKLAAERKREREREESGRWHIRCDNNGTKTSATHTRTRFYTLTQEEAEQY